MKARTIIPLTTPLDTLKSSTASTGQSRHPTVTNIPEYFRLGQRAEKETVTELFKHTDTSFRNSTMRLTCNDAKFYE